MPEAPPDRPDPQDDLLEEMRYALRLAKEREQSAKENIERLKRQFAAHYSTLEERAKSAEKTAERAEAEAAETEERVRKSLKALGLLRCRLTPYAPDEGRNDA